MEMLEAAKEGNLDQLPMVVSGYRTQKKQQQLYDDKVAGYRQEGNSQSEAEELAKQGVSVPGYSEHQIGLAVDINGATYDLYFWLQENSYKYGFIFRYPGDKTDITGVAEEVWHYRYVGVEAATEMYLGLEAAVNGIQVLAGNGRLLSKFQIEYPPELLSITDTIVVCAIGNKYAGYLLLSDSLKEDAKIAIQNLKALGIQNIQILSGDKQSIVSNFAEKLGISEAYGDLLPDGKVKHLEELRQHTENQVAFVGDGMNDAPVLALSNVGIAMGGLGSDAAIETADVVIQTDQPSKVAEAIKVGKLTRRIVWQNISLAFGVKLLVLILGAGGLATLWEAVFADVGVALIAIMNAVRIQKMIK